MKASPDSEEIGAELVRAEKSLKAANVLLDKDLLEDALSRTYYAILHSARAVLLAEGVKVKSHKAVRRLFGQHLVKTGKLEPRYASILAEEQDDRYLADYNVIFLPEKEQVEKRVRDADEFLRTMKRFLKNK
ncbi:MAG: HEPN domain-containing protein [Nitrospirae bacterium]|nr:HEPN domain-containing protein [Nitrospirota bacterium]